MTVKFRYIIAGAFLAPVFVAVPALAQIEGREPSDVTSEMSITQTTTTPVQTTDEDLRSEQQTGRPKPAATLEERVAQRKEERATRLTAAQQNRLKSRCTAAQGVIKTHDLQVNTRFDKRYRAYNNASSLLEKLIDRLEAQDVNVTELKEHLVALEDKLAQYEGDVEAFQSVLADLHTMDCAADPVGFKASLDSARTLRGELLVQVQDIRTYVMETIKPALVELRQQLAGATTAEPVDEGEE